MSETLVVAGACRNTPDAAIRKTDALAVICPDPIDNRGIRSLSNYVQVRNGPKAPC